MIRKLKQTLVRRVVKDATRPFILRITQRNINEGVPKSKTDCVLAKACQSQLGDVIQGVEVGTRVTKLYTPGQVTRYATPSSFTEPIRVYDETGKWILPPGEFEFGALPKTMRTGYKKKEPSTHPGNTARGTGGKTFHARRMPTRSSAFGNFEFAEA